MVMRHLWLYLLFCPALSSAGAQEIEWRTDYKLARQEAAAKNRPLVLDFGTEQCFWCKKLDATTFRDARVLEIINHNFIPLKVDANADAHLTEALGIQSFPTLVFAAPDGKILGTLEGYVEAGPLLAALNAKLEERTQLRLRQARELLAQAREDYRTQQYLCCLERCERLETGFGDLPEGLQGARLAAEIKQNPERLRLACEGLTDRLSGLYLSLAETYTQHDQPQLAARYLERIVQLFPGTPHAETARLRLRDLQGRPTWQAEFQTP